MRPTLPNAAIAAALAVACSCSHEPPTPPNVVWIVWDTARADRMSLYGYPKKTTPFLDEWAKGARVYDDCTSASSWTVPSHASMFTGLLPAEHGAQHGHEYVDEKLATLAELLKTRGYQTFAWTANPHLSDEENFLQGFDRRVHPWDDDQIERARAVIDRKLDGHVPAGFGARQERNAESRWIVKAAGEISLDTWKPWLAERDPRRPFLAFFNFMEAHRPLITERSFRERMMPAADVDASLGLEISWTDTWAYCFGMGEVDPRDLELLSGTYDSALLELDTLFASLMRALDEQGLADDTLVILTADHGEHLGEHHLLDHQYSLSQILIRVPLVVRFPKRFAPGRDARPVMNMDLFPTLLELAGVEAPRTGVGFARSLLDAKERRARIADYSKTFGRPLESVRNVSPDHDVARFERGQFVLIDGSWKLVQEIGGPARLFDLGSDPGELRDASAEQPQVFAEMKKKLGHAAASLKPVTETDGKPPERSPELIEMLKHLGYVDIELERPKAQRDDTERSDARDGD